MSFEGSSTHQRLTCVVKTLGLKKKRELGFTVLWGGVNDIKDSRGMNKFEFIPCDFILESSSHIVSCD